MTPKLFVAGLPYSVTDDQLIEHFSQIGEVIAAHVAIERETGRSRGFGFVEMASVELAQKAIQTLNEAPLNGRNLVVKEAQPSAPRSPRPARRY